VKHILIIGATSAIAQATARLWAMEGSNFCLIARSDEKLELLKNDLKARGAQNAISITADLSDLSTIPVLVRTAFEKIPEYDIVLLAHGTLPDQQHCQKSLESTLEAININGLSSIALLTEIANRMEILEKGTIAVITSVAGDRGRQSNYIYGAAKGMVSVFLQGLRNRLHKAGVNILDIKPGFVDTPMTAHFKKGFLWSSPDEIGNYIYKAIQKQKNLVYTPQFWRYVMLIIGSIPEFLFKRLRL
jgi:decaprenylphospho-beta-D-erythro-pentofuranosid-2-ulose 2-reductase